MGIITMRCAISCCPTVLYILIFELVVYCGHLPTEKSPTKYVGDDELSIGRGLGRRSDYRGIGSAFSTHQMTII